jgi:hypothetical protein
MSNIKVQFARAILTASKIRRDSYNHKKAQESLDMHIVQDFSQFFEVPLQDACTQACSYTELGTEYIDILYMLLKDSADCIFWARGILKEKGEVVNILHKNILG